MRELQNSVKCLDEFWCELTNSDFARLWARVPYLLPIHIPLRSFPVRQELCIPRMAVEIGTNHARTIVGKEPSFQGLPTGFRSCNGEVPRLSRGPI